MKEVEERELSDTEQLLRMVEADTSFIYTQHPATTDSITLENNLEQFCLDNYLFETNARHYSLLHFWIKGLCTSFRQKVQILIISLSHPFIALNLSLFVIH